MGYLTESEVSEMYSHFGEVSEEAKDFAINTALEHSRYIFVSRINGMQKGHCTHCHKEFSTSDYKHNEVAKCLKCSSVCVVKQAGMGRKHLQDDAYFVHFEKSLVDPNAISAIGYYVRRDYSKDYKNVVTSFDRLALYIFEPKLARMYSRSIWEDESQLKRNKSIYSLHETTAMGHKDGFLCRKSVKRAVKGTPFQYSTWDKYSISYLIKFFGLYVQYPGIELLTKIGLGSAVETKLRGLSTGRTINWKGNNLTSLLRLNKQDWKCIPSTKDKFTVFKLQILQEVRKEKSKMTLLEVADACSTLGLESYMSSFNHIRKYTNIRKIFKYAEKQFNNAKKGSYFTEGAVLSTWSDYLRENEKLGVDMTESNVLFPKNLHASHQRNIERKKVAADLALNEKISERAEELSDYRFQYGQYFIRPVESAQEMVAEGEKLKHCVGNYAQRHANGSVNIFVIRHIADPSEPLYTLELSDNVITQCYGYRNSAPDEEMEVFLEAFKGEKLGEVNDQLVAV